MKNPQTVSFLFGDFSVYKDFTKYRPKWLFC